MTKSIEEALLETPAVEFLPGLIGELFVERGQEPESPEDVEEQWRVFRALVNVRPPVPAPPTFLTRQDALLQGIIAARGITTLDQTPVVGSDERLRLWRGDITTLAADTIVNAANSEMLGCFVPGHHCIDNAIQTFAGVQLRLTCARLMDEQGHPEPTGMAKVTDAFNLPSRFVIHTVGPIVGGELAQADRVLLARCYISCLDAAAEAGCASIAFCCISTGVFGFPAGEAVKIAVETVREWLDGHDAPMTVVFNVFSEADESRYRVTLERI